MNSKVKAVRAQLVALTKELEDQCNAELAAMSIEENPLGLRVHHELACRVGKPLVLAMDLANPKKTGSAIAILDRLTDADLHDLHADVEEKLASLPAHGTKANAMKLLLEDIEKRIGGNERTCCVGTAGRDPDGNVVAWTVDESAAEVKEVTLVAPDAKIEHDAEIWDSDGSDCRAAANEGDRTG